MISGIRSLLRSCLLSYGVSNRSSPPAVAQPVIPQTPVAMSEADDLPIDADERLSAWEQDRAATLRDADGCEQQARRHLTRAALLRLVVHFEDEGLFVVAQELRQQADSLGNKQACSVEQSLVEAAF